MGMWLISYTNLLRIRIGSLALISNFSAITSPANLAEISSLLIFQQYDSLFPVIRKVDE